MKSLQLMLRWALCTAMAVSCALSSLGSAQSVAEQGDKALRALDEGDPAAAFADYQRLAKAGVVNGHLYYNLGVAAYRSGHLGEAMAAFLAARRYLPRDPDNDANLRFVLGKIHDKLEPALPEPYVQRLLRRVTGFELAWVTAVAAAIWGLLLLAVALGVLGRADHQRSLRLGLSGGVIPLLCFILTITNIINDTSWGAINQAEAKIYSGPGSQNTQLFALQEGAPVLVTERAAGGYYRIKLSDGKQGWVADNQVGLY